MRLSSLFAVFALVLGAPLSHAADKPTPDEVKKVMTYFKEGKGQGPVLLEFTPCLKIGKKDGEKRKSCVEPAGESIAKKTVVNVWTRWFVPKDDKYDDVEVVFIHEGKIRATKDMKVKTGYAYGTWTAKTLFKPGNWEIKIQHKDQTLGTAKITVSE